jgi:hypothetical protein
VICPPRERLDTTELKKLDVVSRRAWERAMTVQELMLKGLSGELHWFRGGHPGVVAPDVAAMA